jgi:hypothetical protein
MVLIRNIFKLHLTSMGMGIAEVPVWFLQFFNYQDIIYQLERLGFYDLVLPFLLLFSVVFGVLSYTRIFGDNKGIHALIAIVFGFLATRFAFFSDFLNIISPRLGVGLVVLLVLIMLIGLFTPEGSAPVIGWIMIGIGVVVFIIIMFSVGNVFSSSFGGGSFGLTSEFAGLLVMVALLIGVVVAVVVPKNTGGGGGGSAVAKALSSLWPG